MDQTAEGFITEALYEATEFVGWYRRMVMEGQIKTTPYALSKKPQNDAAVARNLMRAQIILMETKHKGPQDDTNKSKISEE